MTPSTGLMRDIYTAYVAEHSNDSWEELFEEFDRWLNEVKAGAWEEGADAGYVDALLGQELLRNPYTLTTESF